MKYTKQERVRALREAGYVQRCHIQQIHGEYNVAMHCYGVACLLMELYPDACPAHLYKAALMHDLPERWTGDIPWPAKRLSPKMNKKLSALESHIQHKTGMILPVLSDTEFEWLKACDMLELWCWAGEQIQLGNSTAKQILRVSGQKLRDTCESGSMIREFMRGYSFERGNDFINDEWDKIEQESL